MIRILVVVLSACVALCGCSKADTGSNNGIVVTTSLADKPVRVGNIPCTFPLVDKPAELTVLIFGHGTIPHENVYVWQQYSVMTGVNVNWTTLTRYNRAEAVYTAIANRQNVDLIMRCRIPSSTLSRYGENGLIINLAKDDMLKKNAPNCWHYLQTHPETLASVMNPDGTIYALPQVNSGAELRVSRKIFINKNWLNAVHMTVPRTTEELYHVLTAFKEQDANGNGDPDDEIPFSSQDWLSIQEVFFGAFGLGNRGLHNQVVDYDTERSTVRLIAASEGYRNYLEYMHRLYRDGLLDKYMFTMTHEQWYTNAKNNAFGMFANTNLAGLPADTARDWIAVDEALEGPAGDKLWTAIRANFHSQGAALIPAACKNPELVLRWLDYFWTDEGTLFYHMGIENKTFVANDDGSYDYIPFIYNEMETMNCPFDDVVARYSPYPGGNNPTVEIAPYFKGGEMAPVPAAAARSLFKYGPKEYWPSFTFTAEENDVLNTVQNDIEKYTDAMLVEFVTGRTPLSKWDEYKEQLNALRLPEMLAIYQTAVDRYHALQP